MNYWKQPLGPLLLDVVWKKIKCNLILTGNSSVPSKYFSSMLYGRLSTDP